MVSREASPALLRAAYARCERIAREHYENFPVASWLLPRAMRPHVAALYAFARRADDFADEDGLEREERVRALDDWGARLDACAAPGAMAAGTKDADLIFTALGASIRELDLPLSLFHDLLSAFRQDVTVNVTRANGETFTIVARCRIDTYNELEYFRSGGILQYVLRNLAA